MSKVDKEFAKKEEIKLLNNGQPITEDLGIIELKIAARLLVAKDFADLDKSDFKIIINDGRLGNLTYRFKIYKPKSICVVGFNVSKDAEKKSFSYFATIKNFLESKQTPVPYQFILISEMCMDQLILDAENLKKLSFRVLVVTDVDRSKNNEEFYKGDLYGNKFPYVNPINLEDSEEVILIQCWKHWLKRFGITEKRLPELIIYSSEQISGWDKNNFPEAVNKFLNYKFGENKFKNFSVHFPKIIFDHHGGGITNVNNFKGKSFISKNCYIPFGKNSKDFLTITQAKPNKDNWLLPFELVEAGLTKILIIDERITTIAYDNYEDKDLRKTIVTKGGFRYKSETDFINWTPTDWKNKIDLKKIDAYWAANIFVATHLNDELVMPGIFDSDSDHWVKITFSESGLKTNTNFHLLSHQVINDVMQSDIEKQSYDVLVIHRTFFNDESIKSYWKNQNLEEVIKVLNKHFPLVIITSGGGNIMNYKGNYKFLSFNDLYQYISNPKNIGKLSLVRNIFSIKG